MTTKPKISIVIPVYNRGEIFSKTLDSLSKQTFKEFELIIVDDCSTDNTLSVVKEHTAVILRNDQNNGPAFSRNRGIDYASGELILFTDSDCWVDEYWVENFYREYKKNPHTVYMGQVEIPMSSFLGNCISALGFPAGGHIGFEKIWKVDKDGYTNHLSSCNMAVPKKIFNQFGLFDIYFPNAGGEDTLFGINLVKDGVKIKFIKSALVYHEPRKDLKSFIKWQVVRGESNYFLKNKIGKVGGLIKLRVWSSINILRKYFFTFKIILVFPLLVLSFILQQWGYYKAKNK